jgi:hypothetical protein
MEVERDQVRGQFTQNIQGGPRINSLASGARTQRSNNNLFINAGAGFGPDGGFERGVPPISASVDFKLPGPTPITLGVGVTYSTWFISVDMSPPVIPPLLPWLPPPPVITYIENTTIRNISSGIRAMYHFNFMERLDTYFGITFGYVHQTYSVETIYAVDDVILSVESITAPGDPFILWGANIGVRYFFNDFIGIYAEVGYSRIQYFSAGLSLKF